ncbi:MAG: HAD-IIA family hydrolase [Gemmatimonadota bacterium]
MADAYLFDLDGTLYQGDEPIPGAVDLIDQFRHSGVRYRFVTNTTSKPRSAIVARLRGYGFTLNDEEVFTALLAGAQLARDMGHTALMPLVPPAALEDLSGFLLQGGTSTNRLSSPAAHRPPAVLVGDLGALWSFDLVQQAFTALMNGADLIALSHDRFWMSGAGLTIDSGAFVKALEYATDKKSILAGKPSPAFYLAAIESLGLNPDRRDVIMVGDDIRSDVGGAQAAGYRGFLVRTGKYREEQAARSGIVPDRIISSVAELINQ